MIREAHPRRRGDREARAKGALEGAEWAREIYHGSKNELRPHTVRGGVRARVRRLGAQPRAGEDRTPRSDGRLEGNGQTEARRQRCSRRPRGEDTRLRRFLSVLAEWTGRFEAPMKAQGGQAREGRT